MVGAQVAQLVEQQMRSIAQPDLVALARSLIQPRLEARQRDYGAPNQEFPCWLVLEHPPSNTGIAYCAEGFGPSNPWGLLFLSGEHLSMGMDSAWFTSLEDALRNCAAWSGENPLGYEVQ
jgi:hypothetical protein